ncbi:MAG: hypothetical protein OEM28_02815 [Nitrosopumilus sp.]|nr:hypothetical protein [Nitrosopumilus sp.]MDH3487041.1 hypothetical protein [Nitrosopumilus sp.]
MSKEHEIDQEFKSRVLASKRKITPKHLSWLTSSTTERFDSSSYPVTDRVDDAGIYGISAASKSLIEQGYPETNIAVDPEYEIRKIVNRQFAENMPVLEKIINSIVDRKLRSMNVTESLDTQNWYESTKKVTSQENVIVMEKLIFELFNKIQVVKKIAYRQSNNKLYLIIVYASQEHEKAFDQIEEELIKLEDALPKYEFEPWILHNLELETRHLHDTKTILQKS